ncbi:MAG: dinitrogenase iron-molybdenum cofactor biosynthesis domain-containing protein [Desulfobacula sp.]|jgi:predicted Fe-Mo cluster-binding NifX family protein|uniref:NifB/NifX family molybdenum-iron cluster-binding protein n=1 Tax=Desulfobacula sp. TaxID=2593537 RepID=UPI001ED551B5|nr:dinitrogenase iron-molybdenum cofactor biosynthesis domain-containing protein [Desulfobacula sp.]MBT3487990.1 dinitrogenase iron-molybdenum cofactor biosynthesis domain-containing protein [Desulfobacula sp.]
MKIAVTIWGNRVSPVFDAAKKLLVVDLKKQKITNKQYLSFDPGSIEDVIGLLKNMQINTLICGAITSRPTELLTDNDIELIPFVSGEALELIDALAKKVDVGKTYIMPGCRPSTLSGKEKL